MFEPLLYIVLPVVLALVVTNVRITWVPIKKKVIDPIHLLGHRVFGLFSGKFPQFKDLNKNHDIEVDKKGIRVVAIIMGAPIPLVVGATIISLAMLVTQIVLSALVLLIGSVITAGALNGLVDLTMSSSRSYFTDALILERETKIEPGIWVLVIWLIALSLSALISLAILL